jgi:hypothetical protein
MRSIAGHGRRSRGTVAILTILVLVISLVEAAAVASAQGSSSGTSEKRTPVGKCLSASGTLISCDASSNAWRALPQQADVYTTDQLIALPGDQAVISLKDGAVRLTLWGNVPELSSAALLESAVILHTNPAADVDLTLERGRVVLAREKAKDPIKVGLHFHGQRWELTLDEAETAVAMELYGGWQPGTPVQEKSEAKEAPVASLVVFVLKGQADLKRGTIQQSLRAPPGPAYFQWNNVSGPDVGPKRRNKLPAWTEKGEPNTPEAQAYRTALERQRGMLADASPVKVLAKSLDQGDRQDRQLAVYGLAALGQIGMVVAALENKDPAVRRAAVPALQHWIGRGPGQDKKLAQIAQAELQYSPAQIGIFMQLLHGFSPDDLERPETYEVLIGYLRAPAAIRALAAWHLYRLVPAGQKIAYNPVGSDAEREEAYKQWKALIPRGKLPPKPKP